MKKEVKFWYDVEIRHKIRENTYVRVTELHFDVCPRHKAVYRM